MKSALKYLLPLICPLFVLLLPRDALPIPDLTVLEQRVIAIFLLAALCWILEPIPIYATSVLIIVLELLLLSDSGIKPLVSGYPEGQLGILMSYKQIMATFAAPIIMLFLGGFFLAMAASKYRLDINLARVMLHPFGTNPRAVLLGLMGITALFSMFMSNTATTAMMLSILVPVLGVFAPQDPGRIAFTLAIPLAANIGGIGTPIGTPPNAIALRYLTGEHAIGFAEWMVFGVPFVLVMMLVAWWLLCWLFPAQQQVIRLEIRGRFLKTPKAWLVYATFLLTLGLWLFGEPLGINSYVVGLVPVAIFTVTRVITKEDLKTISWDVLWLVSGGIALGLAMESTGLAKHMVEAIPFASFSPWLLLLLASLVSLLMANFMSHTATANLLLPLVAAVGAALPNLVEVGGLVALLLAVTFAASLGMSLPISTPPNALAHATGNVDTRQMAKVGVLCGLLGLLLCYLMLLIMGWVGYL
ncbi:SLC13 family permease [Pseudaeromonas paramecii]|uniref:SLC13 family permease n=1 Tax=Pseudaeromonas paramecii TaxID=2138166 RepID=A0ABP8Q444_9GAMM